ncbi:MAG TPA: hypothetical protein VJU13_01005 [Candidatus Nitrosocosmicus sp.]|nr:hypothetical protein [Candidatus Nitrosocosmicus sp.]
MNKNHRLLSLIILYTTPFVFYTLSIPFVNLEPVFAEEGIDTIAVGILPNGVLHNLNSNMHVVNDVSDSVSDIDGDPNMDVDTIAVGILPNGVLHNLNSNMHVVNDVSDSVFGIRHIAISNAGPDQTVTSGDIVKLDGSDSSDLSDSSLLTYQWTQTSGPKVTLDNPTAVHPVFQVPVVQTHEDIVFQLTVTNDHGIESEPDSVSITVNPKITPPVNT